MRDKPQYTDLEHRILEKWLKIQQSLRYLTKQ